MPKAKFVFDEQTVRKASPREREYDVRDRGAKESQPGLLMRVWPSGKKVYYVQVGRGRRERIGDVGTFTLKRARREAQSKLGKVADGHDFTAERKRKKVEAQAKAASTLGGFIDGPWTEYGEGHIASFKRMRVCVKYSFSALLDRPMAEIEKLDIARWKKDRKTRTRKDGTPRKKVTLATMQREVTYLKAILNHAVKTGLIASHKLATFTLKGDLEDVHNPEKIRYLEPAEEARLRRALDVREQTVRTYDATVNAARVRRGLDPLPLPHPDAYADHIKPLVLLALLTGLRRGDLFDLKWSHVDLGLGQIRKVIGKTSHAKRKRGKPVTATILPLAPEAVQILRTLKEHRDGAQVLRTLRAQMEPTDLVFPSPKTGARLDNINNAFEHLMRDAQITEFRFHDLRHTFASRLVQAGVDLNTTRELMTHSDIKMTLVYAHLNPDHKQAALKRAFPGG
jgi:integrase